jgi:hypothetical protein
MTPPGEIMESYIESCRFLSSYNTKFPSAKGNFSLGSTFYTVRDLYHVTAVEFRICLNQLLYSVLKTWIDKGLLQTDYKYVDFGRAMDEDFLISEAITNFKKPIVKKSFSADINLTTKRKLHNIFICKFNFDFENGSCKGQVNTIIKLY